MCLPLTCPLQGTSPATQACALTGNQTSSSLVHRPVLNPLNHTGQGPFFFLLYCVFTVPFLCLDTHTYHVLQMPAVFGTVTCCGGAVGCTVQPRCVIGDTIQVCVRVLYNIHTKTKSPDHTFPIIMWHVTVSSLYPNHC